jgi:ribosome-associated heat shock protein Hsp15
MDTTRVDRWLWAVRLFRTRTAATDACRGGHVRVNGARAKPAATVRAGDRVDVRWRGGRERVVEVVRVIDKRVSPALAGACLLDRTPVPEPGAGGHEPATPRRDRGSGRPSKRERRELDRIRGGGRRA